MNGKTLLLDTNAVIAATAIDFDALLITNDVDLLKLRWPGLHAVKIE